MATTTAAPPAAAAPGFLRRNRIPLIVGGVVVVLLGIAALWTMFTLSFSYSQGERIGFVQKLSKKGWICRTWEGELAMNPVPGSPPTMFPFTVPDEAVAQKIREVEGKRVSLQYEEKRGVPSSCFGESSYFVTGVRAVGN
jgi:hypothetical protein